ncbi:MFS transporter [Propionivibrio soli]|uniref:MFS transporter n=1 Tax=Propionivibrio soli TaxID=2976531 RepID=UPI0021E93254|nr:MFS transporter [Propionivibrio soli]
MDRPQRSFRASFAAMAGLCLSVVLIAINGTVVGTALPRIVAELRGYDLYPWAASAFLMGNAAMIPIAGRLGDLYGRKPFVLAAITAFALASAVCGMSGTMLQFVLARGLQGLAGGMLVGVVFACVPDIFPDLLQRVRWQVMLSASFGIATAVGPSLGGWMTEHLGWRSVFYVNLPVALAAVPVIAWFLPHVVHHDNEDRSIDWLGALFLTAAICGLLLSAEYSQRHGFAAPLSIGSWAATVAFGIAFFRHQYRTSAPIVPPDVMENQGARKLMLLGVMTGFTMFVMVFYIPLLLQGSFGQSPKQAGFVMTPLLVCITVGSIANGRILPHLRRAERLIAWGQMGTLVSCLLLALLNADMPSGWMMAIFALCGISLGFQLPNLTLQMMEVAGRTNFGVASALIQATRMIGSMIGVCVASVLVNGVYARGLKDALARLHIANPEVAELASSPQVLIREQDRAALQSLAHQAGIDTAPLLDAARHALTNGVRASFLLCVLIAAISIAVSLRLPRYGVRTAVQGAD